jgi:hypothetical protein
VNTGAVQLDTVKVRAAIGNKGTLLQITADVKPGMCHMFAPIDMKVVHDLPS